MKFSIIIPYKDIADRGKIFKASIDCLYKHTKNHDNIEIVLHETAPQRTLTDQFIEQYDMVYKFSEWNAIFHRSWNLNVSARHLATGDIFVFFDADLLINKEWVDMLLECDESTVMIGWGQMANLNKKGTGIYLKTGEITDNIERMRKFAPRFAGGGINIINKKDFFKIKGWSEEYSKGYGGPDNSLIHKINKILEVNYNQLNVTVHHLHHDHKTFCPPDRLPILKHHESMNKQQWIQYLSDIPEIGSLGDE